MKANIIGVNSYLGKHMAHKLVAEGWQVYGYGTKNNAIAGINLTEYKKIDITDKATLINLYKDVDFIFIFSAKTGTSDGYENYEEYIKINQIGLLNILSFVRETNCSARIIYPSTRLIYHGVKNTPLTEDSAIEFKTIYALTKYAAEQSLKQFSEYFDVDYTIFRICVPYGNVVGQDFSYGTMSFFLKRAKKGEDIILYGKGENKRTFTFIEDLVNQIFISIKSENSINNTYNVAGEALSLRNVAEYIAAKYEVQVKYIDWPKMALQLESGDTIFNTQKIEQITKPIGPYMKKWLKNQIH